MQGKKRCERSVCWGGEGCFTHTSLVVINGFGTDILSICFSSVMVFILKDSCHIENRHILQVKLFKKEKGY